MKELKHIANVTSTHGLKGYVTLDLIEGDADWFKNLDEVYLFGDEDPKKILDIFSKKNKLIALFEGIDSIDKAEEILDLGVYTNNFDYELKPDEFYIEDLIGMKVFDERNNYCGEVKDVLKNTHADSLLIENEGAIAMVPFLKQFIVNINMNSKKIIVALIDGLIPWL